MIPKRTVLIIDDEPVVQAVCAAILLGRGFECIIKANGVEGLGAYRERQEHICLVLTDVTMPLMNGLSMVREIFAIHPHANVIMMSGYDPVEAIPEEFRRLCSFVQKPFTAPQIIEAVEKCLKYQDAHHPEHHERRTDTTPGQQPTALKPRN